MRPFCGKDAGAGAQTSLCESRWCQKKRELVTSLMGRAQTDEFPSRGSLFWPDFWEPRTHKRCFLGNSELFSCVSRHSWLSRLILRLLSCFSIQLDPHWLGEGGSQRLGGRAMKSPSRPFRGRMQMCPGRAWPRFIFSSHLNT